MRKIFFILSLPLALLSFRCASSTDGGAVGANRRQLFVISEDQVTGMAAKSYEEEKTKARQKNALDQNPDQVMRLQEISKRLIPQTVVFRRDAKNWAWEVHSITSPELNAYCMPGGKIIFYTGIIEKLKLTDAEIAAIVGHEIAHALRQHGRERMSEQMAQQIPLQVAIMSGQMDPKYAQAAQLLLLGALTLPHSRRDETEADEIGVELMARAGYDPREAVNLWNKMAAQGGSKPPAFLSTHPADDQRIENIQSLLPKVLPLYQSAASANSFKSSH